MAIKGTVLFKRLKISNAYVKVRIERVSEIKELVKTPTPTAEDPEAFAENIIKKFLLQYSYEVKADSDAEVIDMGHIECEVDVDKNLYAQAYADLAEKWAISADEI